MKTQFVNEYTGELFEDDKACAASEKKYVETQERKRAEAERIAAEKKRKDSERAERAKEVEVAMQKVIDAKKEYRKVLQSFCKDYGSFHYSLKDTEDFFELVNNIFG